MGSTSGSRSYLGYCQDTQVFTHPSSIVIIRNFGWGSWQGFARVLSGPRAKKRKKHVWHPQRGKKSVPRFFQFVEYQILHHSSSAVCARQRWSTAWIPGSFAIHQLRSAKLLGSAVSSWCLAQLRRLTFQTPWALGLQGDESPYLSTCPLRGRRHRSFDVCPRYAAGSFAAADRLWLRGSFLAWIGWLRCS